MGYHLTCHAWCAVCLMWSYVSCGVVRDCVGCGAMRCGIVCDCRSGPAGALSLVHVKITSLVHV